MGSTYNTVKSKRQREACKTKVDIGGESLKLQQSTYPMHTDKK